MPCQWLKKSKSLYRSSIRTKVYFLRDHQSVGAVWCTLRFTPQTFYAGLKYGAKNDADWKRSVSVKSGRGAYWLYLKRNTVLQFDWLWWAINSEGYSFQDLRNTVYRTRAINIEAHSDPVSVDWFWWPINVRIRWMGGRCANDDWAKPQASAPAEFSYLQFPPSCPEPGSSTFWSFVHIFQHTAPSLAGLNAQARDRFGHFQRRTIGFQLRKVRCWLVCK